jgi:hypothetical protein
MTDDGAALFVHEIDGDNTGRATARRAQSIKTDLNRALMEFSVLTNKPYICVGQTQNKDRMKISRSTVKQMKYPTFDVQIYFSTIYRWW